ncbi:hypothetical protein [Streptomyces sp. NBC_01264]|uniref:hypothetical protein n=1 Tax=Streptomyces sp. NBC_01264 TaxID=2903804 RepID=UPI002259D2DE|nr:hypothetical protein [Streptomyces sp. NBC_01264]MCX4775374.1 hypothetical protein [Streptomyces sp. NBC_01264]
MQPRQVVTTPDHYALTNLRADYRLDTPTTNAYASYKLDGEPQGCNGGVFFALDLVTRNLVPMTNRATSTPDWNTVSFRMTAGQRLVQVMYGDPANPWAGTFVGSAAKLLATDLQTYTATAGNPVAALAEARRLMNTDVTTGRFTQCTETTNTSGWVKVAGRPANGTATVHATCN